MYNIIRWLWYRKNIFFFSYLTVNHGKKTLQILLCNQLFSSLQLLTNNKSLEFSKLRVHEDGKLSMVYLMIDMVFEFLFICLFIYLIF